jgi:hypothetical protein
MASAVVKQLHAQAREGLALPHAWAVGDESLIRRSHLSGSCVLQGQAVYTDNMHALRLLNQILQSAALAVHSQLYWHPSLLIVICAGRV